MNDPKITEPISKKPKEEPFDAPEAILDDYQMFALDLGEGKMLCKEENMDDGAVKSDGNCRAMENSLNDLTENSPDNTEVEKRNLPRASKRKNLSRAEIKNQKSLDHTEHPYSFTTRTAISALKKSSKRKGTQVIVLDEDEFDTEHVVDNSGGRKTKHATLSSDVFELQQKVAKLEDMYQREFCAAREAEKRAEYAEKLLESQQYIFQSMKKAEAKTSMKNSELMQENRRLKNIVFNTTQEAVHLKNENLQLSQRNVLLIRNSQTSGYNTPCDYSPITAPPVTVYDIPDRYNIFQLCHPAIVNSMLIDRALTMLTSTIAKLGEKWKLKWIKYCSVNDNIHSMACEVCKITLPKLDVLDHFFSPRHIRQVRTHGAAVSLNAVHFWNRELQRVAAVAAVISVPPAAAAAASIEPTAAADEPLRLFRSIGVIKKEEIEEEGYEGLNYEM